MYVFPERSDFNDLLPFLAMIEGITLTFRLQLPAESKNICGVIKELLTKDSITNDSSTERKDK